MALFMCGGHKSGTCVWAHPPSFALPRRAVYAVMYWAIFATALPQRLQLFANKILRASLVSVYYGLQPVATLVIGYAIILATPAPHFGLRRARWADLGGLGVLAGLFIVVREEMQLSMVAPRPSAICKTVEHERSMLLHPLPKDDPLRTLQ